MARKKMNQKKMRKIRTKNNRTRKKRGRRRNTFVKTRNLSLQLPHKTLEEVGSRGGSWAPAGPPAGLVFGPIVGAFKLSL